MFRFFFQQNFQTSATTYKQFAILGPESNRSAEASECAAEQGRFWDYHDAVFVDQATNRSALSVDTLTSIAAELSLNLDTFDECLLSNKPS